MTDCILIVEDEPKIATLLTDYLKHAGFDVHVLNDGVDVGPWLVKHRPSAILLDLNLPGLNGLAICESIRKTSDLPIIMITAQVHEQDRLQGLDLGADDYICKPFSPSEVVARVRAVLRRCQKESKATSDIYLDEERLELKLFGQAITLTSIELHLLKPLYNSPGRVFSRDQLMQSMYQDYRIVNDRTIDSHIRKLRKKISSISPDLEIIQSVYATGYRFVQPTG